MGMESGDAAVGSGETSCGSARHGVVYSIKPAHATCHITEDAGYGEEEIYSPYPFGASAQSGMELAADGACSLGREHLDITAHHRRQDGNGEEDYSQSANPLGERAPEQQSAGQGLNIVDDGGTRSGETRHRLEESVGEGETEHRGVGYVGEGEVGDDEGYHAE